MPRYFRLPTLALALVLLAGCQSPASRVSYKITLKDGREYHSSGRPDFQRKTGYYRYKNFQNRDALLRADEVLMIEEQGA